MGRQGSSESCYATRIFAGAFARLRSTSLTLAAGCFIAIAMCSTGQAQPVPGEVTVTKPGDYARVLIKLRSDVEADVRTSGSILIIRFKQPISANVDKLPDSAPDYIGSARVDPDGGAIRIALARKVKPNVMAAGERLFVDLLPDTWAGAPPALPADVVKELADRAREAEKALRRQEQAAATQKKPPIRVRASSQPTFTRYTFEIPAGANVSSVLNKDRLVLVFDDSGLSFDLADAKLTEASNVANIEQSSDRSGTMIEFALLGDTDVHSFREDRNYVVDIGFGAKKEPAKIEALPAAPAREAEPKAIPAVRGDAQSATPAQTVKAAATVPPASHDATERVAAPTLTPPAASPNPAPPTSPPAMVTPSSPANAPAKVVPVAPAASTPLATTLKVAAAVTDTPSLTGASPAITVNRGTHGLTLTVPFSQATAAAAFMNADALWMVFDSEKPLDVSQISRDGGSVIRDAMQMPLSGGQAVRVRLNRPQLASASSDGQAWKIQIADAAQSPPRPLAASRNIADPSLASVTIPFVDARNAYAISDPDTGEKVIAITAPLPTRGFVKRQSFVEFVLLESLHGVVLRPGADDIRAEISPETIVIGRPGGLTLSGAERVGDRASNAPRALFDLGIWNQDKAAEFVARRDALWAAAIKAEGAANHAAHLDIARFYLARGLFPEAKASLASIPEGDPIAASMTIVRGLAAILSGLPDQGLKDLANPTIDSGHDLRLWKAMGLVQKEKWGEARELFKGADFAIGALPIDLQRIAIIDALRASLEVRDFSGVAGRLNELEIVGIPQERQGYVALLRGRTAEALGRDKDALGEYRAAVASSDRISASEAKLYEVALAQKLGQMTSEQAQAELETLAITWRGDATEMKALQQLAKLYDRDGRFRDSLLAARTATMLEPNSDVARQMQDDAAFLFGQLFNGSRADDMPPVQALSLFYEFRELTPIGRRGDEMIRRLADRLANVDLLEQATELLQYQVENRLEGSARAQVASRLAMLYLTNRKPDRALAALRATRIADLAGELRQQRLLLEARGQSDIGRRDLALDIISNLSGREAIRLRSDIHWAARRWREASEQIELMHGERWRDFQPLNDAEKSDIIRAAIGYSLADDALGLSRLKERYAAKLTDESDRDAFDKATKLAAANSAEFAQIAKMAAGVDTLEGFLRDMRKRFPDAVTRAALPEAKPDPTPTGSLPKIEGLRRVDTRR